MYSNASQSVGNAVPVFPNNVSFNLKYMAEFNAVIEESKATNKAYAYVLAWFKKTFPHYGKQPERDANLKIVNTPVNYDAEAVA